MTIKKGSKVVPITLGEYHLRKLNLLCKRAGVSKTAVIQRLIEQFQLFEIETDDKKEGLPD